MHLVLNSAEFEGKARARDYEVDPVPEAGKRDDHMTTMGEHGSRA